MPSTPSFDSREWLIALLDEAGRRLDLAAQAGTVDPQVWWDVGDVSVSAKSHGGGVTFTATSADGTVPVQPFTIPSGWLDAS
jgi:hypothetical protein